MSGGSDVSMINLKSFASNNKEIDLQSVVVFYSRR